MTITEFLLARIAEDEAIAKQVEWSHARQPKVGRFPYSLSGLDTLPSEQAANHAANWSPARVLAECEAKRRIVDRENAHLHDDWRRRSGEHRMTWDAWLVEWGAIMAPTLYDLAAIHADHPDYDEAWRPRA